MAKKRSYHMVSNEGHPFSATLTTDNPNIELIDALKKIADLVYKIPAKCQDKNKGKTDPCKYPLGTCFQCIGNH